MVRPDNTRSFSGLAAVIDEVRPVADAFVVAGHRIYLVGGIVRDLHLGRAADHAFDFDLTTDATPADIKAVLDPLADALWTQGERFGTIGAQIGDRLYEITTHRSDRYERESRKPEVRFSAAIDEDLSRRDFTVNAMALELPAAELVDPFGGAGDLVAGRLRTPRDPHVAFDDDPLRMLRAARFVAGYDLVPAAELVTAMGEMAGRLSIVSAERIRDRLDKLLSLETPSLGLALLEDTGVLAQALPWVGPLPLAALDALGPSSMLRIAALTADAQDVEVRARMRSLRHSGHRIDATARIIRGTRILSSGEVIDAAAFRRWYLDVGGVDGHLDDVRRLATVMSVAGPQLVEQSRDLEHELGAELTDLGSPLDAAAVMGELGIEPGPDVGAALSYLREARLDLGPMSPAAARSMLRRWWATRQ